MRGCARHLGPRRGPVRLLPPGRPRTSDLPRVRQRARRLPVGRRAGHRRYRDRRTVRPRVRRVRCALTCRGTDAERRDAASGGVTRETRPTSAPATQSASPCSHGSGSSSTAPGITSARRVLDDLPDVRLPDGFSLAEVQHRRSRHDLVRRGEPRRACSSPSRPTKASAAAASPAAVMTEGLHRMRAAGMRTRVEHDVTNAAAAALRIARLLCRSF